MNEDMSNTQANTWPKACILHTVWVFVLNTVITLANSKWRIVEIVTYRCIRLGR